VISVFLNRLQSGFLLFETQHGLVRVELSLWQRIYLLWTFRNFRQLSIPLLNLRQRTLVNALFRNNAKVVSHSHNALPVIGVVENFVPPTVRIDASPAPLSGQDSGIQASRPPLRFAYPVYPDVRARGVVSLTAGLSSDGAVRTVRVVSGNRALAAAAVRAVHQWRYRPYLKDGQPVATETNIVISFFSDDAISMSFPPGLPAIH